MAEPVRRRGRPRKETPDAPGTVQALDRAMDLLDLLAARPGLTLSEVAGESGQPPSTVHRVLHTLARRGMVESDPATQSWNIGPATFRLGSARAYVEHDADAAWAWLDARGLVDAAARTLRAPAAHAMA